MLTVSSSLSPVNETGLSQVNVNTRRGQAMTAGNKLVSVISLSCVLCDYNELNRVHYSSQCLLVACIVHSFTKTLYCFSDSICFFCKLC